MGKKKKDLLFALFAFYIFFLLLNEGQGVGTTKSQTPILFR